MASINATLILSTSERSAMGAAPALAPVAPLAMYPFPVPVAIEPPGPGVHVGAAPAVSSTTTEV